MTLHKMRMGHAGVEALVQEMHALHPTSQALVVETLLTALARWARESELQGRLDARNERAVLQTRELLQPSDDRDREMYLGGDFAHLSMYTC